MSLAIAHELLVYARSHPGALLLAEVLRHLGERVYVPGIGYIVSDPDLARAILHDTAHFTKDGPGSMGAIITQVMGAYALLNMEGPAHAQLRGKLADLYSNAYLESVVQEALAAPVATLRRDLAAGGVVDLVRFVHVLSGRMSCSMLGIDIPAGQEEQTYLRIFELGERLAAGMQLATRRLSARDVACSRRYFQEMTAYARECYTQGGGRPHTIVHRLSRLGLGFEEMRAVIAAILLAGTMSISTAFPRLVALLVDTGQFRTLRRHPELMMSAIDEALRIIVPSPAMLRSVASDVVVRGRRYRANRRVLVLTYNLLKQGRYFPHPRRFDITRSPDPRYRYLAFGSGPHFCLGQRLALRQLRLLLDALLALDGDPRIVRRRYAGGVLIPAYAALEIRLAP